MKNLLLLLSLLLLFACSKPKETESNNSTLPASIQKLISESKKSCPGCGFSLSSMKWKDKTIYFRTCKSHICDCAIYYYYDENGVRITDNDLLADYEANAETIEVLFECSDWN